MNYLLPLHVKLTRQCVPGQLDSVLCALSLSQVVPSTPLSLHSLLSPLPHHLILPSSPVSLSVLKVPAMPHMAFNTFCFWNFFVFTLHYRVYCRAGLSVCAKGRAIKLKLIIKLYVQFN